MANEIQVSASLQVNKNSLSYSQIVGTQLYTMTGTKSAGGTQLTTASGVDIQLNGLVGTTLGWAYFRNTSTVGIIQIGTGTGTFVPFMQLSPGEFSLVRLNCQTGAAVPTVKAFSGTPVLQYWIAEN